MSRKFFNGIDVVNSKITSLATGTNPTDAVNKGQMDNAVLGISTPVGVRVRGVGNVDISQLNNGDTIDGVVVATDDRVLLDSQSTASQDGIYVVGATAGSTVRYTGLDTGEDARGLVVITDSGTGAVTTPAGSLLIQTSDPAIIGTNGLGFTVIAAGVTYSADGNGIELTGTTFGLELDGTTLSKGSAGLRIGSGAAGAGLVEASGVLAVGQGTGITVNANDVAIDTSVVLRKFATTIGDNSSTTLTVTHNLGTRDVGVSVHDASTFDEIECDVNKATTNTVTLTFATAPATNAYRCIVWG